MPEQMMSPSQFTGFQLMLRFQDGDTGLHSASLTIPQDTLHTRTADSLRTGDSARPATFSPEQTMRLLEAARIRDQQMDSIRRADSIRKARQAAVVKVPEKQAPVIDSSAYAVFDQYIREADVGYGLQRLGNPDPRTTEVPKTLRAVPKGEIFRQQVPSPDNPPATALLVEKKVVSSHPLESPDWMLGVFLAALVVIAWIRIFYNKYLARAFAGLFVYQQGNKLYRENNLLYQRFSLGMNFLFYITGGLFLYFVNDYFSFDLPWLKGFTGFLILFTALPVLFFLRSLVCGLVGAISLTRDFFNEYVHTIFLINKVLGLVLLPVVIGLPYLPEILTPYLIYGGLGLLGLSYLLRIYKGLQIIILKGFSIFWMILYLCALEILPIVLIYRYIHSIVIQVV